MTFFISAVCLQGCGKTVEVLALILSNPAPCSIVSGILRADGLIESRSPLHDAHIKTFSSITPCSAVVTKHMFVTESASLELASSCRTHHAAYEEDTAGVQGHAGDLRCVAGEAVAGGGQIQAGWQQY